MENSLGQKSSVWDNWWGGVTPNSEIRMWDFYGGRQWITKYVPRFGKTIEGGCGVGRYVFYLRRLGIDIEGIDFSDEVIKKLEESKDHIEPKAVFLKGDILDLPYETNSLSGYISLGVVEHFIEGPQKPIAEAYRALRPGGVAIITTPNISFLLRYRYFKRSIKELIKRIIGKKVDRGDFFQYEYTPEQLKKFVESQGFYVSRAEGCDLIYPFCEIGNFTGENLRKGKFAYWFANAFESTWFKNYGAQSITISIKTAPLMHCFLSGELTATPDSLNMYDVPISKAYQNTDQAKLYLKNKSVSYAAKYDIDPERLSGERKCAISGKKYTVDPIFENYGFDKNVCPDLLIKPEVNMELCTNHISPVWRKRTE